MYTYIHTYIHTYPCIHTYIHIPAEQAADSTFAKKLEVYIYAKKLEVAYIYDA
jgi:hypothetical protein